MLEWAVILVQATVACAICILFHLLQLQSYTCSSNCCMCYMHSISPATVAVSKVYSVLKCLDTKIH